MTARRKTIQDPQAGPIDEAQLPRLSRKAWERSLEEKRRALRGRRHWKEGQTYTCPRCGRRTLVGRNDLRHGAFNILNGHSIFRMERSPAFEMVRMLAGRGRLEVLAHLRRQPEPPPTMNQLSRQLGVPLATVWHAVHDLEDLGLVVLVRVGGSALVRPNRSHPAWKSVSGLLDLDIASPHRLAYDFFADRLKRKLPTVDVHLFGSVRNGTYRPSSDVDVEVVFGRSGESREQVQRACVEVAQATFDRFRITVAAVVSFRKLVAARA